MGVRLCRIKLVSCFTLSIIQITFNAKTTFLEIKKYSVILFERLALQGTHCKKQFYPCLPAVNISDKFMLQRTLE